jgi:geranylgeranyl diphosphate synthase type II
VTPTKLRVNLSEEFDQCLAAKRLLVEEHLRLTLRRLEKETPAALLEAMGYSLLAPGKRLRPLLVVLAAEVGGGSDAEALAAASAVEMVHTYSLIHDDLPAMDDDDLRRGLPTCHKKYGEALAILAGDALLTEAFAVLAEAYPPATAAGCCKELAIASGARGMVGGQVDDLAWEKRGGTIEDLESLHARKTGALFRSCLRLGLLVAQGERAGGADSTVRHQLDEYGRCLGLAFQITDDLVDVESTAEVAGKHVQKDAVRGKLTYPGFLGKADSFRRAERLCQDAQESLAPLGSTARPLADLLQKILLRDR